VPGIFERLLQPKLPFFHNIQNDFPGARDKTGSMKEKQKENKFQYAGRKIILSVRGDVI